MAFPKPKFWEFLGFFTPLACLSVMSLYVERFCGPTRLKWPRPDASLDRTLA